VAIFATHIYSHVVKVPASTPSLDIPSLHFPQRSNPGLNARGTSPNPFNAPNLVNSPSLTLDTVHTTVDYDPNWIASAVLWSEFANKGSFLRCLLSIAPHALHRPQPMARYPKKSILQFPTIQYKTYTSPPQTN
jgi:hypothetical protein